MGSILLITRNPILQCLLGGSVQQFAGLPVDVRILGVELLVGTGDVAAAGGGEEDDGLALKAIGLDESIDDGGGSVPPYREADVDDIVAVCILQVHHYGRTGGFIPHFQRAAGLLVAPVQIGRSVFHFGFDLIEGGAGHFGQTFGHGLGGAGGGKISYEGFHFFL